MTEGQMNRGYRQEGESDDRRTEEQSLWRQQSQMTEGQKNRTIEGTGKAGRQKYYRTGAREAGDQDDSWTQDR